LHVAREDQPKYRQIASALRARIEAGEYAPGDRLPTKAQLMETYSVALNTADNAVRLLRSLGFAETRHGTGTYVCDPLPSAEPVPGNDELAARMDGLAEEVRQLREEVDALKRRAAGPAPGTTDNSVPP
jgi:DNA-binding GntR family transcriptional regulator